MVLSVYGIDRNNPVFESLKAIIFHQAKSKFINHLVGTESERKNALPNE